MRLIFITLILCFVLQVKAQAPCIHSEKAFRCVRYVKNYDADTITVDIPNVHPLIGKNISIRVRHIDAPEMKGSLPCEKEVSRMARNLVENLLKNAKVIDLENVDRDKYFRILADVMVDGKNLKEFLIKNNLAYSYDGGTKKKIDWCIRLPSSGSLEMNQ